MMKQFSLFPEEDPVPPENPLRIWWHLPRGIRAIDLRIYVALSCFKKVCEGKIWNREIELALEQEYRDNGVVKDCQAELGENGTGRTITTGLKALGFFYRDQDKRSFLILAAEDMLRENNLMEIAFYQLMKFQYPSYYSSGKIMPEGQIRPILFVLRLLLNLGKLTRIEMCIVVCLAKKWSDYDRCVSLIREYRRTGDVQEIIEAHGPKEYALLVKSYNKKVANNRVSNSNEFLKPLLEEVQTLRCNLTCIGLLKKQRNILELAEDIPDKKMEFIKVCIEDSEKNPVNPETDLILLQKKYGSWQGKRVSRSPVISSYRKTAREFILESFHKHSKESLEPHRIAEAIHSELGLDLTHIENVISPHLTEGETIFEQNFIESSTEKQRATEFERNTCELFNKRFGYQAYHTGQMNREIREEGKFSDVLLVVDQESCIIIDNKATQDSYCMSQKDRDAMLFRYSKSLPELIRKYSLNKGIQLKGICYISFSFNRAINKNLQYLSEEIGIPISAIRANDLINLSRKGISKENFLRIMCQAKIISLSDF